MLATVADTLQVIHLAVLGLGTLCGVGVLVWLARRRRWRNPLAGVPLPRHGPSIVAVAVVLFAFFTLQLALRSTLTPATTQPAVVAPGSDAWHRTMAVEQTVALVVAGLIVVILTYTGHAPTRRSGFWRGTAAAVLALLVLLPIVALQEQAGRIVWRWLHPDLAPPVHAVLQALAHSAWGSWGRWQLIIGAVLVAPLTEELFFRGLLLQAVCHHTGTGWAAILVSAAAFGAVHAQPQDVLPLVSMGILLGYLRLATGSVWPCVLLHMLFNARTMTFVLLAPELLRAA